MEKYPLWYDNMQVGNVAVQKVGLYYSFECVCDIATDVILRVKVHCDDTITDLGICVPENGNYTLRKKVPVKSIGNGNLQFYVENRRELENRSFPLYADKPFEGIDSLVNAKWMMKDGEHYIYWD